MGRSRKTTIALASGTAALVAVAGVWLVLGGGSGGPAAAPDQSLVAASTAETTTTVPPTTASTTVTSTTTTTTTTTTQPPTRTTPRKAAPVPVMPAPVPPPANVPVPPPPHPTPPPGCAPSHVGTNASTADVKSALVGAAGTNYWSGVANPPLQAVSSGGSGGNTSAPPSSPTLGPPATITIPPALIQALAWQESGWQSNIVSCDGGHGVMQLMSATATWMNNRFGTSYDYTTLSGNAAVGGEYIAWLIAYFGENSFGHQYDLSDPDLMAAVLDAYNAGPSSVQFANGHTVVSHYAATVLALMNQQPWNN